LWLVEEVDDNLTIGQSILTRSGEVTLEDLEIVSKVPNALS
jgi:hypothetical protein